MVVRGGSRAGAVTSPYYGMYGYPHYAGTVIHLTGGYGYAPNYSYAAALRSVSL